MTGRRGRGRFPAVRIPPPLSPLRLLLALLLAVSALGAAPREAYAARDHEHEEAVLTRAATRVPGRMLPALPDLAATLPAGPSHLPAAPAVAVPDAPRAAGVRPARGGPASVRVRGPPR